MDSSSEYGGHRLTADEMDEIRQKNIAYQYLCHLEEAKKWIEACIEEVLPDAEYFEENLRHGVYLAKLANFFSPNPISQKKIFDFMLERYNNNGLHFRHTDNINYFLKALKEIGLPSIFYPETTDIYDKKNIPRAIFCIHALSLYLFRLGIAPQIQNLYGKIKFSDQVMEAMMKELSKFGCQLPQFGKIGGILANELPIDEASLHAAIIAINEAIEKEDSKELHSTLINPNSHITGVNAENIDNYLVSLKEAKQEKKEIAINKSRDENYIPDAYDELLTQAEIQGFVSYTNLSTAVQKVENAVYSNDYLALMNSLKCPVLCLKDIKKECSKLYMEALQLEMNVRKDQSFNQSLGNCILSKTSIYRIIAGVNDRIEEMNNNVAKLARLNKCLEDGSSKDTLNALYAMKDLFGSVALLPSVATLYHEEMAAIRFDAETDLTLDEVVGGVKLLTAIGHINIALDKGNSSEIWQRLNDPKVHIQNLDRSYANEYVSCLTKAKLLKAEDEDPCDMLTYLDVQETIDNVNLKKTEHNDKIRILTNLNKAINDSDVNSVISYLQNPSLELQNFSINDGIHYYKLLKDLKETKCKELGGTDVALWLEDVFDVNEMVQHHLKKVSGITSFLRKINHALIIGNRDMIPNILRTCNIDDIHVRRDLIPDVSYSLFDTFSSRKRSGKDRYQFIEYSLQDGSRVYINIETGEYQWDRPNDYQNVPDYISIDDILNAIQTTVQDIELSRKVENSIVQLQSVCRGYLVRKKCHLYLTAAIKIQSWWRMVQMRRNYEMYRKALRMWEPQIIKIQRAFRKYILKKRLNSLTAHFSKKEHQVMVIQRAWRKYKARQDLRSLTHRKNPPLNVIRKFVHLLEVSSQDFEEELRLQKLKTEIVQIIRRTQTLESRVDELDVKIGLLVQNRITLQEVVNPDKENTNPNIPEPGNKKHKKVHRDHDKYATVRSHRGLKALTKDSRERLTGYQHLFYLLQTEPHYLASLIFALPAGKTTKFIENVIFTLYNYGANDRDNYLLLKLFKTALEEEIRCKVLRLSDIVSGNPLVVKMVVSFNRKGAGQVSLRDMLAPLVNKVVSDPDLQINTNPVEIYKTWVNQLEMSTGQPSGLPYVVNQEEALKYPEVQQRLFKAINALRDTSLAFCNHITSSRQKIPYAMQYIAKVMKAAVHKRFPHIPEKEILKVVGNLIYYRFINSAIVAPDAFDIITVTPDKKLANDQRRNLASIAKILQFAASKKGFGEEASHLMCLNSFIIESHEKFKAFFKECCMVEEPEEVYNINQYSEATIIVKPTIYMTLQEIVETHELLLVHRDILASDPKDPLHEILEELGDKPSIFTLLGETPNFEISGTIGSVGRTEVCLALSKKYDPKVDSLEQQREEKNASQKLFIKTKQLIIDLLRCIDGDVLFDLTKGPTLSEQESKYRSIVLTRNQQETRAKQNDTGLNRSNSFLGETRVSLHEVKTKLSHNLRRLETQGLASRADNYQTLLNAIATDIVNQREYRVFRRNELQKLVNTSRQLETKENFFKDQLQSYKTYLQTCLSNIAGRNKNVHQSNIKQSEKKKNTLKYTAIKLHEKGIILEIEDLPVQQLKNVLFEITPLAITGVFQVQVKFMGVAMEVVQLDIQELLQLQYEGVSVKRMMGKAKVNINLLLHFLNAKFYSKKK